MNKKIVTALAALCAASCASEPGRSDGEEDVLSTASALSWTEQQKLTAGDAAAASRFGGSVAVSGDTAVVGAMFDDEAGSDAGAAYVFVRMDGVWTQQQKLLASDAAADDHFGASISVSGESVIVGSPGNDKKSADAGAAYVFVRSAGAWTEEQKLVSSDGAVGDRFGGAVSISMDTAVVGASHDADKGADTGAAYVFERTAGAWSEKTKLGAVDGAAGDLFGSAVAVDGVTVVVGAFQGDEKGAESGAAYVFASTVGLWMPQQKLTAKDGTAGDNFGGAVAISGDTALIGALYDSDKAIAAGSAYVFSRAGSAWGELQKIIPSDGAVGSRFGVSVALSGDIAAVGSFANNDKGQDTGAVYVYERPSDVFAGETKIFAADGASKDDFSASIGVAATTLVVGSPASDGAAADGGAAYVYDGKSSNGKTCNDGVECLSGQCVDGVCCNSACGGGALTDCQACSKAAGGVVDGTCGLVAKGLECRASTGECDAPEVCDGSGLGCPADGPAADGTKCSIGVCQKGACGEAVAAPPPAPSDDGFCSYTPRVSESAGAGGRRASSAGFFLLAMAALASRRRRG